MVAPTISGISILVPLNGRGHGSVFTETTLSANDGAARDGQYDSDCPALRYDPPGIYGWRTDGASGWLPPYNMAGGKLFGIGFRETIPLTSRQQLNSKADRGCAIRAYSNPGYTEYREWLILGSDSSSSSFYRININQRATLYYVPLVDPSDATFANFTTSNFSSGTIYRIEVRFESTIQTFSKSFNFNRIWLIDPSAHIKGGESVDAGDLSDNAATLEHYITFVDETIRAHLYQKLARSVLFLFPVNIGNGTDRVVFVDKNKSIALKSPQASSANPLLYAYNSSSVGFSIKAVANSYIGLYNYSIAAEDSAYPFPFSVSVEAGSDVFFRSLHVSAAILGLIGGNYQAGSFADCTPLDNHSGATFLRISFEECATSGGAVEPESAALFNSCFENCSFSNNTIGPALYLKHAGVYDLSTHNFSGNIFNVTVDGAAVTLTLSAAQLAAYNTDVNSFPVEIVNGGIVSVTGPISQIVVLGLPSAEGVRLMVHNLTSAAQVFYTVTGGTIAIPSNPSDTYVLRAIAPTHLASDYIELQGNTPQYRFNLVDISHIYNAGVTRFDAIDFNPTTYLIRLIGPIAFEDAVRTIGDYLSAMQDGVVQGLLYTAHPIPIQVADRSILRFPYDHIADTINPARLQPAPTAVEDPELLFEVDLEGAADPTYDLLLPGVDAGGNFNGVKIRASKVVNFAKVTISGDGALTTEQAAALGLLPAIAERTSRVDGLLEPRTPDAGDRLKSEALEAAPAGGGGGSGDATLSNQAAIIQALAEIKGSGFTSANSLKAIRDNALTAQQVWEFATRSLTDKTGFALSAPAIAAIEAALINEGDGQQLIDAIVQVINADLDVPALELAAIAEAVRNNLATELARIDLPISSRATPANVSTAIAASDLSSLVEADGIGGYRFKAGALSEGALTWGEAEVSELAAAIAALIDIPDIDLSGLDSSAIASAVVSGLSESGVGISSTAIAAIRNGLATSQALTARTLEAGQYFSADKLSNQASQTAIAQAVADAVGDDIARVEALLAADEKVRPDFYQKLHPLTKAILLHKVVSREGSSVDLTEA